MERMTKFDVTCTIECKKKKKKKNVKSVMFTSIKKLRARHHWILGKMLDERQGHIELRHSSVSLCR